MAERVGQHRSPGRAMKERGLRAGGHESFPALHRGGVGIQFECVQVHRGAWCLMDSRDASGTLW